MSSTLPLPPEPDPTTQIRDDRGHSTEMISTDAEPVSLATFDRALGSLARLMVRAYQTDVNWEAKGTGMDGATLSGFTAAFARVGE